MLLALNQSWHVWCFKCIECGAVLQGEYMSHNGKPLCLRDYNNLYGIKCFECERFIAGKVLEVLFFFTIKNSLNFVFDKKIFT